MGTFGPRAAYHSDRRGIQGVLRVPGLTGGRPGALFAAQAGAVVPADSGAHMKRKLEAAPRTTRQQLADPHVGVPFRKRLEQAGAIDLRNNKVVEDHGNGYVTVRPADPTKRFTDKG